MTEDHRHAPTRLQVQTEADGTVRIQQQAHSRSAGWYVQKTLRVPPDALHALIIELRKSQCLSAHAVVRTCHERLTTPLETKPFHPLDRRQAL